MMIRRFSAILLILFLLANAKANNFKFRSDTDTMTEAEKCVYKFLMALNNRDYWTAYQLTDNPNWGDYQSFSSTKGFGGISQVIIYELRELAIPPDFYNVYVRAFYKDTINGSHIFSQIFKVKYVKNSMKITGMFLLKKGKSLLNAPKIGYYKVNIGEGGITIKNVDRINKKFDFEIFITCPTLHTAEAEGTAYFKKYYWEFFKQDVDFPCHLRFYFFKNNVIIEEVSCSDWHGARCFFDGLLTFQK